MTPIFILILLVVFISVYSKNKKKNKDTFPKEYLSMIKFRHKSTNY